MHAWPNLLVITPSIISLWFYATMPQYDYDYDKVIWIFQFQIVHQQCSESKDMFLTFSWQNVGNWTERCLNQLLSMEPWLLWGAGNSSPRVHNSILKLVLSFIYYPQLPTMVPLAPVGFDLSFRLESGQSNQDLVNLVILLRRSNASTPLSRLSPMRFRAMLPRVPLRICKRLVTWPSRWHRLRRFILRMCSWSRPRGTTTRAVQTMTRRLWATTWAWSSTMPNSSGPIRWGCLSLIFSNQSGNRQRNAWRQRPLTHDQVTRGVECKCNPILQTRVAVDFIQTELQTLV